MENLWNDVTTTGYGGNRDQVDAGWMELVASPGDHGADCITLDEADLLDVRTLR